MNPREAENGMAPDHASRLQHATITAARVAASVAFAVGLTVLTGWLFDLPALTQILWFGPNVKTNAALALTCGALANLVRLGRRDDRRSTVIRVLAAIPATIGALTLSEHIVGWDLGIDQLLAEEPAGALATVSPNRMGPPASMAFMLLGTALLLNHSRRRGLAALAQGCTYVACVVAILPIMGYAYGFSPLYAVARYTGIALPTAVSILLLAVSVLAAQPDRGLVGMLCRTDEVGTTVRGLLPAALLLPFGGGWLLARAVQAQVIDGAFALSIMALVLVVGLSVLVARTGAELAAAIDARVAAERAVSASERSLREADRQKTEFLATLSHELRNPLAPIRFAVELLGGPAPVAERARRTISRQTTHLVRLIDDLLDLTRITRNKLEIHPHAVEMRPLVLDAIDAVSSEIAQARHSLAVELPDNAVWLHADPDRVVQILTNLLTNAARYTPPGGTVTIGAEIEHADVVLFVRDTGAGLAATDLQRVFEMFVQVGEARGGLGIGLALVKGLVDLHNGSVEARSEGPGRGAEFRVRLPRANAPVLPQGESASGSPLQARRILVVDDNKDAADTLGDVLRQRGHVVAVAYDAEEALRRIAAFRPDVGLFDIGMPGMSGHALAERVRADASSGKILLVAITGWGQEEDRRRTLMAGFDAHLTKPADPEAILALIAARESLTPGGR